MAPRSRQVMLSYPSSLQSHSDFPTPVTPLLPVSSGLTGAYHSRNSVETLGSQVPHHYLSPHAIGYSGSPAGAFTLYFPADAGLLQTLRGSACISPSANLSLPRTLPATPVRVSLTKLHHSLLSYGLRLWPAPLARYDPRAMHGPSRYRVGASSACTSKRVIDVTTSFQVIR